ncbi:sporulation YhaL family protein [Bacillus suaedaesalsae]|uniref:Sporulation YhaL family protein n=1 Tax=Bacillus suaedaesalsae TaxID=2810349 RepID=A0ABS2DI47_9BACI|nr:sporulation YhaL family protein [Bacillus suaedaesalsae]MBM6617685.1 sporulation YhaL family protein [Bacillus suaedaesalsae]
MITVPWWIYVVMTGVGVSGVMMVKTGKREREMRQFYIEREGQVFMERMKYEREKRQQQEQRREEIEIKAAN